jgi:hypothetical protein
MAIKWTRASLGKISPLWSPSKEKDYGRNRLSGAAADPNSYLFSMYCAMAQHSLCGGSRYERGRKPCECPCHKKGAE